jgi:hypothetical protein
MKEEDLLLQQTIQMYGLEADFSSHAQGFNLLLALNKKTGTIPEKADIFYCYQCGHFHDDIEVEPLCLGTIEDDDDTSSLSELSQLEDDKAARETASGPTTPFPDNKTTGTRPKVFPSLQAAAEVLPKPQDKSAQDPVNTCDTCEGPSGHSSFTCGLTAAKDDLAKKSYNIADTSLLNLDPHRPVVRRAKTPPGKIRAELRIGPKKNPKLRRPTTNKREGPAFNKHEDPIHVKAANRRDNYYRIRDIHPNGNFSEMCTKACQKGMSSL